MAAPPLRDPAQYVNKQEDWFRYYDQQRRKEVAALLTDEVVAEHQANPVGYRQPHSAPLQRVLNYMRTQPVLGKYFVYTLSAWSDYVVAEINERGEPPTLLEDHHYKSEAEAMHAVFLMRAADIRADVEGSDR